MPKTIKEKYPEVKEIRDDLESLKDNTVELAQHVKKDSLEQIDDATQTLKTQTKAELRKIEKYVKQSPFQSVAIAFAGGVLATMLLNRR